MLRYDAVDDVAITILKNKAFSAANATVLVAVNDVAMQSSKRYVSLTNNVNLKLNSNIGR